MPEPSTAPEPPTARPDAPTKGQPGAPESQTPRPQRRPLPSPLAVITAGLGLFFIVLTLLAIQVRNGRDPALGPGPAVQSSSQPLAKGSKTQQATQVVSRTSPVPP
jgi:hypothetical protein